MIPSVQLSDVSEPVPSDWFVLDVREDDEWNAGHMQGAHHIPLADVPARAGELPTDQKVLVVCKSGGRSGQAVDYLTQRGYEAINLEGGMMEWQATGRPMVSETGTRPTVG